jgi:cell wall-associated NlpC family hydrolase
VSGAELARAAECLVGTPFRLHGRDPATGLDCVGLLDAALAAMGRPAPSPKAYGVRNRDIVAALAFAPGMGLGEVSGPIHPGDVLLVRAGPLQDHLLIAASGKRFIHAHAGLRRVVATPGPIAWPILRHWRLTL